MSNQMKEIDWDKAPEGATHYDTRRNCCSIGFMKPGVRRGEWEYFGIDGHWILYGLLDRDIHDAMVEVPKSPAWTGEGLPPVGTVCEVFFPNDWHETTVIGVDTRGLCVFESPWVDPQTPYAAVGTPRSFRPIRTPEQIAAEERQKAIDALAAELAGHWSSEAVSLQRETAAYLHDIGYRKVTP